MWHNNSLACSICHNGDLTFTSPRGTITDQDSPLMGLEGYLRCVCLSQTNNTTLRRISCQLSGENPHHHSEYLPWGWAWQSNEAPLRRWAAAVILHPNPHTHAHPYRALFLKACFTCLRSKNRKGGITLMQIDFAECNFHIAKAAIWKIIIKTTTSASVAPWASG